MATTLTMSNYRPFLERPHPHPWSWIEMATILTTPTTVCFLERPHPHPWSWIWMATTLTTPTTVYFLEWPHPHPWSWIWMATTLTTLTFLLCPITLSYRPDIVKHGLISLYTVMVSGSCFTLLKEKWRNWFCIRLDIVGVQFLPNRCWVKLPLPWTCNLVTNKAIQGFRVLLNTFEQILVIFKPVLDHS